MTPKVLKPCQAGHRQHNAVGIYWSAGDNTVAYVVFLGSLFVIYMHVYSSGCKYMKLHFYMSFHNNS